LGGVELFQALINEPYEEPVASAHILWVWMCKAWQWLSLKGFWLALQDSLNVYLLE